MGDLLTASRSPRPARPGLRSRSPLRRGFEAGPCSGERCNNVCTADQKWVLERFRSWSNHCMDAFPITMIYSPAECFRAITLFFRALQSNFEQSGLPKPLRIDFHCVVRFFSTAVLGLHK